MLCLQSNDLLAGLLNRFQSAKILADIQMYHACKKRTSSQTANHPSSSLSRSTLHRKNTKSVMPDLLAAILAGMISKKEVTMKMA